jgi:hypothetical protein
MKARIADVGGAADLGKLLIEETEKWSKVIRTAANIKPE